MKNKLICIMLCFIMAALSVTGCARNSQNPGSTVTGTCNYKEFITVDVYDEFANYQGIQSGWFAKAVKNRFNMELNIIAPNISGGDAVLQTRSAMGNIGDLVVVNTANGKFNDLVNSDLLFDCENLVKNKDIMKNYSNAIIKTNKLAGRKGIYGFPNSISSQAATEPSEVMDPTFGPYIRWDYYKKLGYPEMENLDDFLDVLEDMQKLARKEEGCDDIYAISLFKTWDDNMMNNAKQIACMYGYDELGFVLSKADGSAYQNIIDSGSIYIKVLEFFNKANERGLADPDSMSQNYDTWITKYKEGKVLYSPWPWTGQSTFNTDGNTAKGKGFKIAPVKDMQIFSFGCWPDGDSTRVIAIGSNAKDPQRMADFIDWLYSPEGMQINGNANGAAGPLGLTWKISTNGQPVLTEFGKKALFGGQVEVPEEYGGGDWDAGRPALNFRAVNINNIDPFTKEPYDYTCWKSTVKSNKNALEDDWKEKMGADTAIEYLIKHNMLLTAPGANYSTPAEDINITTVRERCKEMVVKNSWKIIFAPASSFNRLIKEMQDTARALGYDDVYKTDLKNAKDQAAARKAYAEKYKTAG